MSRVILPVSQRGRQRISQGTAVSLLAWVSLISPLSSAADSAVDVAIISKENQVDTLTPPETEAWLPATVGQKLAFHDRVRTGEDSRVAVRLSDASILRLDEFTEAEILPPAISTAKPTLDLKQASGATSFIMIDGEVETSNDNGSLVVRSGQRADIKPGTRPSRSKVSHPLEFARWCFYYPAVLDPKEVIDSLPDRDPLQASLEAYSQGDLRRGLEQYPRHRSPSSPEEKLYRAQLLLASGQADKAEGLLEELDPNLPSQQALLTLIAAVTPSQRKATTRLQSASDRIAESYYRQSNDDLTRAEQAAMRATRVNPNFGLGWTRLAEVEFSRGQPSQASQALEKALSLAPANPAAYVLRGSILSAESNFDEAIAAFDKALALNGSLGDAWAGRGLCLIRQGKTSAGRRDLYTAAALEPNRAIFRKYLNQATDTTGHSSTRKRERNRRAEATAGSASAARPPSADATPEPIYQGRLPGSAVRIRPPIKLFRALDPGTPSRRPSGSQTTSRPEHTPGPGKDKPSAPSKRPERTQSTPPSTRGKAVPAAPSHQGQTPSRKKTPRAGQSPQPN
jgi:tetratricopeptide (TPR) repeat protein